MLKAVKFGAKVVFWPITVVVWLEKPIEDANDWCFL